MPVIIYVGITLGLVLITVNVTLKHYSTVKLIFSDILSVFGFLGKWVRKERVSSEVEGTLNGVINDFNRNFTSPLLPNCKIQWVTSENQQTVLKENHAIICLSFDKKDHDLNFYNATFNFIQTALVAKTKPFIRKTTAKAMDLLSTKIILRQYRREILRTFNNKFRDVEPDVKDIFHRLDETDQNGLFSTLLLPEVYHIGETLNDKTPNTAIELEIEQFLNWFYNLATREFDEKSILKYESTNIKVGVILVAKLSTYNQYGAQIYTNWAEKYASDNFGAVYLLAKGTHRNTIAKEVCDILTNTKGFVKVNKNEVIRKIDEEGKAIHHTCISLRPDLVTIRYNAWEYIKSKFVKNELVVGIVETVTPDAIFVNVNGLQVGVSKKELSGATITDATKLFFENQELKLKILECKVDENLLSLSNIGTDTDPKLFIDANLSNENPVRATVKKIQKDREGNIRGLIVKVSIPDIYVFIPASRATYSRFADLSKKYPIDSEVEIILQEFQFDFGNYVGKIHDLPDPYQGTTFNNLALGNIVEITIKDIQERFVVGEIEEGLECRLYATEVSWNQSECNTSKFEIEEVVKAKVVFLEKDIQRISVSLKQIISSPTRDYFHANEEKIIQVTISKIDDNKGLYFSAPSIPSEGFVHWSEISWAYLNHLSANFNVGQIISVKVFQFREEYNSIQYSCKRCIQHQFDEFILALDDYTYVSGEIINHYRDIAIVKLSYKGLTVQAYIHKSKISCCTFINSEDIPIYLPKGNIFNFVVARIDKRNSLVELSRKIYLQELEDLEIGETYSVYFTKSYNGKYFFYSEDLEGFIYNGKKHFSVGKQIEVMPVSSSSDEFIIAT